MGIYFYSLASVGLVSLVSFVGVFGFSLQTETLKKYIFVLVSLAVGALLGDAILHLLPGAFVEITNTTALSLSIIAGILTFFILEKSLHWHHHSEKCSSRHLVGRMILFSDGLHNFVDGLIISASYFVSVEVGLATTLAVVLHEIPQEIGDFGVLLHAGYTKARALWWNFISALFAVAGALVAFALGEIAEIVNIWLLPIAAGGFIYVALSDLVPELNKTKATSKSLIQLVAIVAGIFAMFLLLGLEA